MVTISKDLGKTKAWHCDTCQCSRRLSRALTLLFWFLERWWNFIILVCRAGETLLLLMGILILSLSVSRIRWELTSVQIVNKPWLYCQRSKSQRLSAQILGEKQTRNTRALTIASIADKPLTLWKLRCCRIQKSETKERILKKKHWSW